jgi:predicted amidohydrolase YtcJ
LTIGCSGAPCGDALAGYSPLLLKPHQLGAIRQAPTSAAAMHDALSRMPVPAAPDALAIENASIWTGDPRRPWADALLVHGDRIAAVGSSAEVKKRAGSAPVLDAKGRMVTPGVMENEVGLLSPGASADLVILDRPIARVAADTIRDAGAVLTITAGRVVYDRDGLTR